MPTLDEQAWRATEPHTPHPRARLEAVAELKRAGIRAGILVAPLMPGINDSPEQLAPILERRGRRELTTSRVSPCICAGDVKGLFFDWLAEHRPDLPGTTGSSTAAARTRPRRSGLAWEGPEIPGARFARLQTRQPTKA